ncbi:MAG: hypothetical protein GX236_03270 [Clostridiaceae bacterium]|nr:hypothetical protein [Clostridiaceae bacterium]
MITRGSINESIINAMNLVDSVIFIGSEAKLFEGIKIESALSCIQFKVDKMYRTPL